MNSTKKQKFEYTGKLEDYQLYKKNTYTKYEVDKYSLYQNYLYKRALYGLKSLNIEELELMCNKKKYRINSVHRRAQRALNLVKQRKVITITNNFFKTLFPNSNFTNALINNTETDEKFRNNLNFKDLKIDKDQIISTFINEGILPKNFLSLKRNPNQLPRLKVNIKSL
tara:strand:+ start:37 stop:543 length:507 start_codon:yes stop_codon:yes gene_type:complete